MDKSSFTTITKRLEQYKSLPQKMKPAMESIADYVRGEMIPNVFEREGPGWKKLAKRTVRERLEKGYPGKHPILQRSRDLYKELTDKSHPHHIEIIRVGKNARIEIGGSSAKFLENQLGKPAQRLPARPMIPGTGNIPLLDRDRLRMSQIIEKNYQRMLIKPR